MALSKLIRKHGLDEGDVATSHFGSAYGYALDKAELRKLQWMESWDFV